MDTQVRHMGVITQMRHTRVIRYTGETRGLLATQVRHMRVVRHTDETLKGNQTNS